MTRCSVSPFLVLFVSMVAGGCSSLDGPLGIDPGADGSLRKSDSEEHTISVQGALKPPASNQDRDASVSEGGVDAAVALGDMADNTATDSSSESLSSTSSVIRDEADDTRADDTQTDDTNESDNSSNDSAPTRDPASSDNGNPKGDDGASNDSASSDSDTSTTPLDSPTVFDAGLGDVPLDAGAECAFGEILETESKPCGYCGLQVDYYACTPDRQWSSQPTSGECLGAGSCQPGTSETDTRACGPCGKGTQSGIRYCTDMCTWGAYSWSLCDVPTEVCDPELAQTEVDERECSHTAQTRTSECTDQCSWSWSTWAPAAGCDCDWRKGTTTCNEAGEEAVCSCPGTVVSSPMKNGCGDETSLITVDVDCGAGRVVAKCRAVLDASNIDSADVSSLSCTPGSQTTRCSYFVELWNNPANCAEHHCDVQCVTPGSLP